MTVLPPMNKRTSQELKRLGIINCPVCKGQGFYKRGCAGTASCKYCKGQGLVKLNKGR